MALFLFFPEKSTYFYKITQCTITISPSSRSVISSFLFKLQNVLLQYGGTIMIKQIKNHLNYTMRYYNLILKKHLKKQWKN